MLCNIFCFYNTYTIANSISKLKGTIEENTTVILMRVSCVRVGESDAFVIF